MRLAESTSGYRRPGKLSRARRGDETEKGERGKKEGSGEVGGAAGGGGRKDKRREGKKSRRSGELTRATVPGVCVSSLVQSPREERRNGGKRGGDEPRLNLGCEKGARWRTRCHRRRTNAERTFNCAINSLIRHAPSLCDIFAIIHTRY